MYPDFIKKLPRVKTPFPGVKGWVAQGENHQIVFFEIEPTGEVTPHAHAAQFGVVFEGEMELTIGDETREISKGDTYFIPESVVHQAKFKTFVRVMDYFDDPNRYELETDG